MADPHAILEPRLYSGMADDSKEAAEPSSEKVKVEEDPTSKESNKSKETPDEEKKLPSVKEKGTKKRSKKSKKSIGSSKSKKKDKKRTKRKITVMVKRKPPKLAKDGGKSQGCVDETDLKIWVFILTGFVTIMLTILMTCLWLGRAMDKSGAWLALSIMTTLMFTVAIANLIIVFIWFYNCCRDCKLCIMWTIIGLQVFNLLLIIAPLILAFQVESYQPMLNFVLFVAYVLAAGIFIAIDVLICIFLCS